MLPFNCWLMSSIDGNMKKTMRSIESRDWSGKTFSFKNNVFEKKLIRNKIRCETSSDYIVRDLLRTGQENGNNWLVWKKKKLENDYVRLKCCSYTESQVDGIKRKPSLKNW